MRIQLVFLACVVFADTTITSAENSLEMMVDQTLIISEQEEQRLKSLENLGVIEVKPVALPMGRYLI